MNYNLFILNIIILINLQIVNSGCVQCTGRGQQQINSPPHGAEPSQQTNTGQSSSTQHQHETIEYVDGHRLVRIPLIDYIRESRTRNYRILVYDSRNIFSYGQVNVNFVTYNLMRDEKLILMEIILSTNTFLANNALEIFKHFAKEKFTRNGGHLYNRIICMLGQVVGSELSQSHIPTATPNSKISLNNWDWNFQRKSLFYITIF
uniref:Uncharacterized protein n=1 Tax=Meloidogyne enterolobii TaxID=390850 RepID=A0A6V7XKM0_MELEN|nr:unnamed protein product [Meloidogyne enterolobii]